MVSLGDDSTRRGGYFFSGEGGAHTDFLNDEEELLGSGLSSEDQPRFIPLRTGWTAFLQMAIMIACEVLVVVIPLVIVDDVHPNLDLGEQQVSSLMLIVYMQSLVWLLAVALQGFLVQVHHSHMCQGYLLLYRKTRILKRVPVCVFSCGSVALMVLTAIYLPSVKNPPSSRVWPVMYAQIIVSLEVLITIISLILYLVRVVRFNQKRSLPDVEQEEYTASITQPSTNMPDIGYRDSSYMENLLEKQADMIHYMRLHTAHLSKKILRLTRLTHPTGNAMSSIRYT